MRTVLLAVFLLSLICHGLATTLQVKEGRTAIVKTEPTGNAEQIARIGEGTKVQQLGDAPRYFSIQLQDGTVGWSWKGSFEVVADGDIDPIADDEFQSSEALGARTDLLQIIVLDVEVGDATLIICPEEDGQRDVILIDTGEDDSDRIGDELTSLGFQLALKPITTFIASHYDHDHIGDVEEILPWSQMVYDRGDQYIKTSYLAAISQPGVDRRAMTLDFQETFSGGVTIECVAVNTATDFHPDREASKKDENANSIALIIEYGDFQYFTAGDLTSAPEKSLATGIENCDVYHVNHHGSRATSSRRDFVKRLDPEVSVVSNGTRHGHPTRDVADRLTQEVGSVFFQTNVNLDPRANQPDPMFVGDDTYTEDGDEENAEGAIGTIRIAVDDEKYYILMAGLELKEGLSVFKIER